MPLTDEQIIALLGRKTRGSKTSNSTAPKVAKYLPTVQAGPIRWYDKEMRCTSNRCNSPTYIKFQGVPKCMMHVIKACNEMFIDMGIAS